MSSPSRGETLKIKFRGTHLFRSNSLPSLAQRPGRYFHSTRNGTHKQIRKFAKLLQRLHELIALLLISARSTLFPPSRTPREYIRAIGAGYSSLQATDWSNLESAPPLHAKTTLLSNLPHSILSSLATLFDPYPSTGTRSPGSQSRTLSPIRQRIRRRHPDLVARSRDPQTPLDSA